MRSVEICQEIVIKYVISWDPWSFLRAIPLPVHQIFLITPTQDLLVDLLYRVDRYILQHYRESFFFFFLQASLNRISLVESHTFSPGWQVGVVAPRISAWCLWHCNASWRRDVLSPRPCHSPGTNDWLMVRPNAKYALEKGEIRRGLTESEFCGTRPRGWIGSRSSGGCGRRYRGRALSPGSFSLFDHCSVGGIQKIGWWSHLGADVHLEENICFSIFWSLDERRWWNGFG